jgi:hypothetical protein
MSSDSFEDIPELKGQRCTAADTEHFTKLLRVTPAVTDAISEYLGTSFSDGSAAPSQPEDDLAADDPIPQPNLSYANFHLREPETRRIMVADASLGASWEQLKTGD